MAQPIRFPTGSRRLGLGGLTALAATGGVVTQPTYVQPAARIGHTTVAAFVDRVHRIYDEALLQQDAQTSPSDAFEPTN